MCNTWVALAVGVGVLARLPHGHSFSGWLTIRSIISSCLFDRIFYYRCHLYLELEDSNWKQYIGNIGKFLCLVNCVFIVL